MIEQLPVSFVEFNENLVTHFSRLNLEWINKHFKVEPEDTKVLSNPQKEIIDKGGFIFFAKKGEEIVGTFALIKVDEKIFELSKMAVDPNFQGNSIGNKMLEFCIGQAKIAGAEKIILYSNTGLLPAIHLYKKFGFIQAPLGNVEYQRANIKMELNLNK